MKRFHEVGAGNRYEHTSNSEIGKASKLPGQIPGKRAEGWVCLTATGLNLIGRVGYTIFTTKALEENWMDHTKNLGQLDWLKEANIWQGTIVQNNRIMNQQVPLKRAFENVCKILKLA
jgi:DNA sulfur modification protein DndB